jgi:hypothetical protein
MTQKNLDTLLSSTKQKMRRNSFREKYKKELAITPAFVLLCPCRERAALTTYSTTTMILPFPADSAEFEEYVFVMESMADEAEASTPDPEPPDDSYPYGEYDPYENYNWRDDR